MNARLPDVSRIALTPAAARLVRDLTARHGPLMFHQSGGCCDGSSPMCYPRGEFRTGASDVLLAELVVGEVDEPVGFWMSADQFERWRHTHLTVDVVPGRGSGFSLEAPEGVRFLIRSRLLTDHEARVLGDGNAAADAAGLPQDEDASARESVCRRSGGPGRA
ncbi:DUF779 domain-containing protein [Streptomyces triculaminicus]|uniref:DUF779 domain-containing protein n=1 Tax=Streptomyces triculaminicus TaxID=2816232 RepID=UPI0037D93A10